MLAEWLGSDVRAIVMRCVRQVPGTTSRTVAAILANPRYTGRHVWNRQYTHQREAVPGDRRSSRGLVRVWNSRSDCVISAKPTPRAGQ